MSEVTNKGGALRKVGRATAWVGKKWVWTVTGDWREARHNAKRIYNLLKSLTGRTYREESFSDAVSPASPEREGSRCPLPVSACAFRTVWPDGDCCRRVPRASALVAQSYQPRPHVLRRSRVEHHPFLGHQVPSGPDP